MVGWSRGTPVRWRSVCLLQMKLVLISQSLYCHLMITKVGQHVGTYLWFLHRSVTCVFYIELIQLIYRYYYPTALRRVQITPKTSANITRYLYSRGPVRQVCLSLLLLTNQLAVFRAPIPFRFAYFCHAFPVNKYPRNTLART